MGLLCNCHVGALLPYIHNVIRPSPLRGVKVLPTQKNDLTQPPAVVTAKNKTKQNKTKRHPGCLRSRPRHRGGSMLKPKLKPLNSQLAFLVISFRNPTVLVGSSSWPFQESGVVFCLLVVHPWCHSYRPERKHKDLLYTNMKNKRSLCLRPERHVFHKRSEEPKACIPLQAQ